MNKRIIQEEQNAYNTFLNNLNKLFTTSAEVTSSSLGDILLMDGSDFQRLGRYFKALGYGGSLLEIRKSLEQHSVTPISQYVLGAAIAMLAIPTGTGILTSTAGAYLIGQLAEALWESFENLGAWLVENQNNETEAIRNLLANKNIIITDEHVTCPIDLFIDQYNLLYEFDDLIKELSDDFSTASNTRSPLAIDLDGDGVETITIGNGIYFDHDGNGFAEKSGWINSDDGILVRDIDNNGKIDNGSELFGDNTVLQNGNKATNGFEALADLDSNKDGVFDGDDEAFDQVLVWKDNNFSEALATDFLSRYSVIDQRIDSASGFQATVFKNNTTNKYTIAIAGTDPFSSADLYNDADIATRGIATNQFIQAYNYYQQITHTTGTTITQISGPLSTEPAAGNYVAQTQTTVNYDTGLPETETYYYLLEEVNNTNTSEKIPVGSTVEFTGHSLGGHLAALMSIVADKTAAIFNAPGYKMGTVHSPLGMSDSSFDCLITELLGSASLSQNITHYETIDGNSVVTAVGKPFCTATQVDCFYDGKAPLEYHGIHNIVLKFLFEDVVKNILTEPYSNVCLSKDYNAEVFKNVYAAFRFMNGNRDNEVNFTNLEKLQDKIFGIKSWIENSTAEGILVAA